MREKSVRIGNRDYDIAYDDAYGETLAETFEPELSETLLAAAPADCVALDIGANLGLTALLLSQVAAVVHAFEAVPSTQAILGQNLASAATQNVIVHPFGLGDAEATIVMVRDTNNRSGAFVGGGALPEGHAEERAEIRTLDSVEIEPGALFIKIDVEGFELQVLRGAQRLLRDRAPVVVLEMNHWCLNAFQRTSIPDFLDSLRAVFPHLYALDEVSGQVADLHDLSAAYGVMHEHIVHFRFMTVLGCFHREQAIPALAACERRAAARAATAEAPPVRRSLAARVAGRITR